MKVMQSQALKNYKLPDKPGVYFFMKTSPKPSTGRRGQAPSHFQEKAGDEVLYIGKATSLKDRVKSYFPSTALGAGRLMDSRGPLIVDMVTKANGLKWQETDSVLEALILEANLIKKHQPYYNTKEKDDKSFNYVCITKEKLPKVLIVRGRNLQKKQKNSTAFALPFGEGLGGAFGPFPNGGQLKEALKIIRRIFPFLDDKSKNNYEFYKQLGLAPDVPLIRGNEGVVSYLNNIKNIKLFFEGKKQKIVKNLEKEMKIFAKNHEFEKAGEIKRQIFALKHINDVALIKDPEFLPFPLGRVGGGVFRIEAYDIAHMSGQNMVGVMTVLEDGEVNKNEYRKFSARGGSALGGKTILGGGKPNDTGALLEILERRFNHPEWQYPKLIVIDGGKAQLNVIKKFQARVGLAIPVVAVVKDERHKAKGILGDKEIIKKFEKSILLANAEAHRFAITYHRKIRGKIV